MRFHFEALGHEAGFVWLRIGKIEVVEVTSGVDLHGLLTRDTIFHLSLVLHFKKRTGSIVLAIQQSGQTEMVLRRTSATKLTFTAQTILGKAPEALRS